MKEVLLTNYSVCFPDPGSINEYGIPQNFLFLPYVSLKEIEGNSYKEFYWKCSTCGERAVQENRLGEINEVVLSCACRSNYSYSVDFATELAAAADQVPLSEITE